MPKFLHDDDNAMAVTIPRDFSENSRAKNKMIAFPVFIYRHCRNIVQHTDRDLQKVKPLLLVGWLVGCIGV